MQHADLRLATAYVWEWLTPRTESTTQKLDECGSGRRRRFRSKQGFGISSKHRREPEAEPVADAGASSDAEPMQEPSRFQTKRWRRTEDVIDHRSSPVELVDD